MQVWLILDTPVWIWLQISSRSSMLAGSAVSLAAFKSLHPIHVFDVSKQSERLTGVVDLTVRKEFIANVPVNTPVYALIISD